MNKKTILQQKRQQILDIATQYGLKPAILPTLSATLGVNTMNQIDFINELCSLVFNCDANPEYIYPYLQQNLNFLNDELIYILRNTLWSRLRSVSLTEVQGWAYSLGNKETKKKTFI